MNSKSELKEIIAAEIKEKGPLPFTSFMDKCLYHPEHGYYYSGKTQVGRQGDFYTSVSVGPLFGKLIAEHIAQLYEFFPDKKLFTIAEQGSHDGTLAHDILSQLEKLHPEIQSSYLIIEPSAKLQSLQKDTLSRYSDRVQWISDWNELSDRSFTGVLLSNELIDSFPVHLIKFKDGKWMEQTVKETTPHSFAFSEQPISNPLLINWIHRFQIPEIENYETEINLASQEWMRLISKKINFGYILTIDYGMTAEEFYTPERNKGTLQCYFKHTKSENPFLHLGQQDITTHVNFTALHDAGDHYGIKTIGYHDQHHFLASIIAHQPDLIQDEKEIRAFKTLMHPEMMGTSFKVLLQQKDLQPACYQRVTFTQYSKNP